MTLGEKLKQARLEAGLSQRQLCADVITRNMLSQIENGIARPSMDTLSFLAVRLGKTVSYFLEEDAVTSPNLGIMAQTRQAFEQKDWAQVLKCLEDYRQPDPVFYREKRLLQQMVTLELAEEALNRGKIPYGKDLLEEMEWEAGDYCREELIRRKLLLLGKAAPEKIGEICRKLPSLDEELLLRAAAALEQGNTLRSSQLLDAAEDQTSARWNYLRGEVYLSGRQFTKAAVCFLNAEREFPRRCIPKLERCYRELGNYEKAYEYACKQRESAIG